MNPPSVDDNSSELSFSDFYHFIKRHLLLISIYSMAGIVMGLLVYKAYPAYKASVLMPNTSDALLIKKLQFVLPRMADSLEDSNPMKLRLRSEKFWTENFVANYTIKKQDVKDLKDLQDAKKDEASAPTLTLTLREKSNEELNANMEIFISYVKDKAALYFIEDLATTMKFQSSVFFATFEKNVSELNYEKRFTLKKIANLELIGQQVKGTTAPQSSQLFDLKDGGSKFLPVSVQLIALKKELSDIDLQLERLQDSFDENNVRIVVQAAIVENLKSCSDGLRCLEALLEYVRAEEQSTKYKSLGAQIGFKRIKGQLELAASQNANGFAVLTGVSVERTGFFMFLIAGLFGGALIGAFAALIRESLNSRKVASAVPS